MDDHPEVLTERGLLEQRILRLEEQVDVLRSEVRGRGHAPFHPAWPLVLGIAALASGYLGLGLPQHYYQPLFAGLLLLLAYHRRFLFFSRGGWRWPQIAVNFILITLLFKLLIGGGLAHPFDWLKVPVITRVPPPEEGSWYGKIVPDFAVQWQAVPKVSEWAVDLTKIQTLLLIATLAGALFRFQPFTSITALALLLISVPTYLGFNWDGVVVFLVLGSVTIYLQTRWDRANRGIG